MPASSTDAWDSALREHREAVEAFIASAGQVGDAGWNRPVSEGKWSPAQIAEHVRLSHAVLLQELGGAGGLRVRTSWWLRAIIRRTILPRILRTGRIPTGVQAVREVRPGDGPFEQGATLGRLRAEADQFARELSERRTAATLTHPYFGTLSAADALRLTTAHTLHHRGQLAPQP
jgi:hypothetical protein